MDVLLPVTTELEAGDKLAIVRVDSLPQPQTIEIDIIIRMNNSILIAMFRICLLDTSSLGKVPKKYKIICFIIMQGTDLIFIIHINLV